jgi:putative ABC transport system permease protein
VAGVQPLLGRPLVEADEQPAAQPVVLIGERVWKQLFHGDPAVVGQTVRLGRLHSTVVGVMPESFAFPVSHGAWAPLRTYALDARPREGSPIRVFGRLRAGKTMDEAQAELSVLGARASAENPTTHEYIRPEIMPYPRSFFNASWSMVTAAAFSSQLGVLVFLVLVCANVATLVFARTATRESEIVVRNALGASRGRIVTQLLVETLVLGGFAALIGLSVAAYGIRVALNLIDTQATLPFWMSDGLSVLTMFYAALLTILAAVIAGVVPALKVTRGLGQRLRQAAVGGANLQFGRIWTGLIVTQVALTVVFMTIAFDTQRDTTRARALMFGFRANEYLSVRLEMDREAAATEAAEVPYSKEEFERFRTSFGELERRLLAEPAVAGVTYAQSFPGMYHERGRIEVDGSAAPPKSGSGHQTLIASVGVNYFGALEVPIVAGRGFQSGDLDNGDPVSRPTGSSLPRSRAVIVNQTFVQQVFSGGNAVGRRVRYVFCGGEKCNGDPRLRPNEAGKVDEWYEIIGVVKDIAMTGDPDRLAYGLGGVYHPWAPGDSYWAGLALHVRGDPDEFAARLRTIAAAVDPSLRLNDVRALDDLYNESLKPYDIAYRGTLIASAIVLLLSVAGIYSITAFTVARRTREIGIRVALGGNPRRILWAVFSRAILQVTMGVAAGGTLMVALMRGIKTADEALILLVPIGIMLGVCALACIVPTRRALRVQPTQALSAGG